MSQPEDSQTPELSSPNADDLAKLERSRRRAYRVLGGILKGTVLLGTKRTWRGLDKLPAGGCIVAANHVSQFDPLTAAHPLYDHGRPPVIMAKASLWNVPMLGTILRRSGQIPVFRGTAEAAKSLELAGERLEQGACILVFPEGTLTKDPDLWPMLAKTGVARLALATRQPVVPLSQWGAHKILPRGAKLLRLIPRKPVSVTVGEPVDLSDLYDKPLDGVVLREATNRIMAAITANLAVLRDQEPPSSPWDARTSRRVEDEG